ncbi:Zn-dependent M28 family amino/carboxypeptidase [Caulobacter ginsengisoli]|uniref:Zn-dependent M28 family amino/carboxypeptidase n=1 Tax=Caulobacter ginsengisoli TaxID=400775 RepID=A0ABU0IKA8_9CAUL|nr:M20/M25/M40 family metallo-hydrolase [Caulobacter ginsengisoli]MDQ0462441.1 Zn-dependent M28 family amino/carboxypeptidase [Caulobacter ginsengisoli]
MLRRLLLAGLALGSLAMASLPPKDADRLIDDVRILAADDMQGRLVGTPGSAKARAYILQRFAEIDIVPILPAGFEQPFDFSHRGEPGKGVNIVGQIVGTDPSLPVLVVSAHYDHLGIRDGEIYNGADDNASGVAGLLAIAQAFKAKPPRHTVIFAVFDAEEEGLKGAKAFVAATPVPLARVALDLNLDMIGTNDKNELYVSGAFPFPWLRGRLEALAADAPVTLKLGHDDPKLGADDWSDQSDQGAFGAAGRPWVYFGVEDHPEYHKPADKFATIPQPFFKAAVATVVAAALAFEADLDAIAERKG